MGDFRCSTPVDCPQEANVSPDDLVLQPKSGPFHEWSAKEPVETSLGAFAIEVRLSLAEKGPPDSVVIAEAESLAAFVRHHADAVLDKIWEHYKFYTENERWMELCEVPLGLSRVELAPYLHDLTLVIEKDEEPTIYLCPQWDEEHGLYMAVRDGRLEFRDV